MKLFKGAESYLYQLPTDAVSMRSARQAQHLSQVFLPPQVIRPLKLSFRMSKSEVRLFFDPIFNACLILKDCLDLQIIQ